MAGCCGGLIPGNMGSGLSALMVPKRLPLSGIAEPEPSVLLRRCLMRRKRFLEQPDHPRLDSVVFEGWG